MTTQEAPMIIRVGGKEFTLPLSDIAVFCAPDGGGCWALNILASDETVAQRLRDIRQCVADVEKA